MTANWNIEPGDWDNQEDWGPKYAGWWQVCERCGGFYNWFRIEVIEGVKLLGWLHLGGCCDGSEDQEGGELEVFDTRGKKSGQ